MKLPCLIVLLGVSTFSGIAQNAGPNAGGGRGGGISFVTRRVPTSGAGVQAANFFAAGGVPTGNVTANASSAAVSAPGLAASTSPLPAISDAKVLAALRQAATRGDKDAQRLLQGGSPSPVAGTQRGSAVDAPRRR